MDYYYLSKWEREQTEFSPLRVKNCYVYLYMFSGRVFYVGCGQKRRAWKPHSQDVEALRWKATLLNKFRVRIVKEGMLKTQAHLLETEQILLYQRAGHTLLNVQKNDKHYKKTLPKLDYRR